MSTSNSIIHSRCTEAGASMTGILLLAFNRASIVSAARFGFFKTNAETIRIINYQRSAR